MSLSSFLTRRRLIQQSGTVALTGMVGGRRRHQVLVPPRVSARVPDSVPECVRDAGTGTVDPELVRTLALRSLDAARAAGATYADVRITRTIQESFKASWAREAWETTDSQEVAVGTRALVNGYWGFAATPYLTLEEAARVGAMAAAQAKINAEGPARSFAFAHTPVVTGSWRTPIALDPFRITMEEKLDDLRSIIVAAKRLLPETVRSGESLAVGDVNKIAASFRRQERALATSEGTYVTQTVYDASGALPISYRRSRDGLILSVEAHGLTQCGKGWELLSDAKILDQLPRMLEELESKRPLPFRGVEVGRLPIVCDATTAAGLLDVTLGRATEVDRALGYEANTTGTSYFGPDPLATLGTAVASPLVTVTANRSLPGGLATVQWDAEGVTPDDFTVVRDGTLVDYQTTREQAAWLAPWYQKTGMPPKSHGCANASDASGVTMQMAPNLALTPATTPAGYEELLAGMTNGIALEGCTTTTDFQCRTGTMSGGTVYQVRQGKRVAQLLNAGVLFETAGLWKSVTALGSAASVMQVPLSQTKGEPSQRAMHTVSSVPLVVNAMNIVDITRKA
jgi:TldD protein